MDEFISSGEQKWGQRSGVVLLLPHGYEGQGPDHSSARIERFLSLCAQDNMTVAHADHPGQLLPPAPLAGAVRPAQAARWCSRPSRCCGSRTATSPVAEFTAGAFHPVIGDEAGLDPAGVRKVLLCSGKIYYDLAARRDKEGRTDTAVVRLERLYPLPDAELLSRAGPLPGRRGGRPGSRRSRPTWAPGRPWRCKLPDILGRRIGRISVPPSSAPAVGSATAHKAEHERRGGRSRRPGVSHVLHRPGHRGAADRRGDR